jgi:hypothetical protein
MLEYLSKSLDYLPIGLFTVGLGITAYYAWKLMSINSTPPVQPSRLPCYRQDSTYQKLISIVDKARSQWEESITENRPDIGEKLYFYELSEQILNNWMVLWHMKNPNYQEVEFTHNPLVIIPLSTQDIENFHNYYMENIRESSTIGEQFLMGLWFLF